ncbi:MAG: hypothetical protein R2568_00590 [Candidatus Scalindua sp.]|jgi:hypothetical protein|nr:hypothetical protein [Candidatus Scalindua sp.]MDV5165230.1 hypothetical protein [Candidatus Scalindua sp.]
MDSPIEKKQNGIIDERYIKGKYQRRGRGKRMEKDWEVYVSNRILEFRFSILMVTFCVSIVYYANKVFNPNGKAV